MKMNRRKLPRFMAVLILALFITGCSEEEGESGPPPNVFINYEDIKKCEEITLTRNSTDDLVIGSDQILEISVSQEYISCNWYLNGELKVLSGSVSFLISMDEWDFNTIGIQTVTVVVQIGDMFYSESLTFNVVRRAQ